MSREADTLVIGAGAAGLAAARLLLEAGRDVLVPEARDRIGGRVHPHRAEGFPVPIELGAEFVHGTPAEIWSVIAANGLVTWDLRSGTTWSRGASSMRRPTTSGLASGRCWQVSTPAPPTARWTRRSAPFTPLQMPRWRGVPVDTSRGFTRRISAD